MRYQAWISLSSLLIFCSGLSFGFALGTYVAHLRQRNCPPKPLDKHAP